MTNHGLRCGSTRRCSYVGIKIPQRVGQAPPQFMSNIISHSFKRLATMTSQTSKQLQLLQIGGPFKVIDVQSSQALAPDHVLIRQSVIALNPVDKKRKDPQSKDNVVFALDSDSVSSLPPNSFIQGMDPALCHYPTSPPSSEPYSLPQSQPCKEYWNMRSGYCSSTD